MPVVGSQYKGTVYTLPGCVIRYLCLFSDEAPPVPAGELEGFTLAALSGTPAHAIQRGIVAEYLTPAADQAPEFGVEDLTWRVGIGTGCVVAPAGMVTPTWTA